MASQEHYSLRWNDHQNQILLAFDALLQTKSLVDVTLVCAETSIRAHKVVLSACSPFFQRVFAENPCKHPVIVLKDFSGWVVQAIVDFMYRGEISVPQERLQTLIQAGESLQVRGLIDHPVTGNTPTPAASPDDFNGLITKRDGSFKGETKFEAEPSLYYQPQCYIDGNFFGGSDKIYDALCMSPMPRRKQARPRRRSGDFSPPPSKLSNGEARSEDCENNKNFKNIDGDSEHPEKGSLSKSSSVQSLDTAVEEPEDLCTKPADEESTASPKELQKRSSSGSASEMQSEKGCERKERGEVMSANGVSAKRHSGNSKDRQGSDNRIVLSLKDIRHFNNMTSDSQRAHQLMASRFLNQSPSSILKTMSNHLGLSAAGGRMSPKSLADAKFQAAMQLRGPPMDLTGARHSKFFGMHVNDDDEPEEDDDDEQQDKSLADEAMDAESGDEQQKQDRDSDDGKSRSKEAKSERRSRNHNADVGDNNNNNRLDMLMSMGGPNPLLMDHIEFQKHRQQLFQQQQQNGLESLKSGQNLSHSRQSSSGPHDLLAEAHGRPKDFSMSLPPPFNMHQSGDAHPPFPPMPSVSSLALTPPHMFGLDTPLGMFPPGMDPSKLYSPLMEMSDPRGMHPEQQPYLKKKGKFLGRPKGQHSAPRGGPPRSWTNAELTEALQHVWNKKMTTSQASRIFGIPYNSLLMYVRGKYGKSLKLEQLRKDCISGPPIELLQMGVNKGSGSGNPNGANSNNSSTSKDNSSHHNSSGGSSASNKDLKDFDMPMGAGGGGGGGGQDLLSGANPMFNPFPGNFYPDFAAAGFPLSMLNLLPPPPDRQAPAAQDDEDCKSEDRSKQSLEESLEDFAGTPLRTPNLNALHRPEIMQHQEIM